MYTKRELKKITKTILRPNHIPLDGNANEQAIDYSFSVEEKLPIHLEASEGTKPLFNEEYANKIRSASPASSIDVEEEKRELEQVFYKLDSMVKELKGKAKDADIHIKKRSRDCSGSRSSSYFEYSRSNTISPRRKRMRKDSEYSDRRQNENHKYGHSSNTFTQAQNEDKRENKKRYRDDRSGCSSSSSDSSDSYLPRKLEKDMSTVLNDSFLSKHSSSSRRSNCKYSRNNKRKRDRKSEKRQDNYNNHDDYYRQGSSYYHDMKERYARYYTVMYAFNIIMDILRKDDLYNNHY